MASPATQLVVESGNPYVSGLTNGTRWSLGAGRTVTWALADLPGDFFWADPFGSAVVASTILSRFEEVANIHFSFHGHFANPNATSANIVITATQFPDYWLPNSGAVAWAYFPNDALTDQILEMQNITNYPNASGDIWLNFADPQVYGSSYLPGSTGHFIALHELGHAVGLKHPHDNGGTGRPTFSELDIGVLDEQLLTVMSYNESTTVAAWFRQYGLPSEVGFPATLMPLDVLALQYLYGPNNSTRASNTMYPVFNDDYLETFWDAGGIDVIDARSSLFGWNIELYDTSPLTRGHTLAVAFPDDWANVSTGKFFFNIENVNGSNSSDVISGNSRSNQLRGFNGEDFINGGAGNDIIYGGGAEDIVYGSGGGDWIFGEAADDSLWGGPGGDRVYGGGGNDVLSGGAGWDFLNGGHGNDQYIVTSTETTADRIRDTGEAEEVDTLKSFDVTNLKIENIFSVDQNGIEKIQGAGLGSNIVASNSNQVIGWDFSGISLSAIDSIVGGVYGDSIIDSAESNTINGANGNDSIQGRDGNDIIFGSHGHDWLLGQGGNDSIWGGPGADRLNGNAGDDVLSGGAGTDFLNGGYGNDRYVIGASENSVDVIMDTGPDIDIDVLVAGEINALALVPDFSRASTGIEKIQGSSTGSVVVLTQLDAKASWDFSDIELVNIVKIDGSILGDNIVGSDSGDLIAGAAGNDLIWGGNGNDYLFGSINNDWLLGEAGNDRMFGGSGSDNLRGGPGNDWLFGDDGVDSLRGNEGNDLYRIDNLAEIDRDHVDPGIDTVQSAISYSLGSHQERLVLLGSGNLNGVGNSEDNTLKGNVGENVLWAGGGNDYLDGGAGADQLFGGAGNDSITFDSEDRYLEGGVGDDTLLIGCADIVFDFKTIGANVSGGFEILDLTGTGDNSIRIDATDVLEMSDSGLLRIDGDIGDAAETTDGWTIEAGGPVSIGTNFYTVYTQGDASLVVDTDIDQSGIIVV